MNLVRKVGGVGASPHKLVLILAACLIATPAYADPVSDIAALLVATFEIGATTATVIASIITVAISTGLSYVINALTAPSASAKAPAGVNGVIQIGGTLARSFIVGEFATAGSLVYVGTWGQAGATPNAYLTTVIALSDLPMASLTEFWVDNSKATISGTPVSQGTPVTQYNTGGADYLWVKFYDGSQGSADSFLISTFGSDANYPWTSDMIAPGTAYAIVTARINTSLFSGFPQYKFAGHGAKLYDPRLDTTVGGSGSQRLATPSTWTWTNNPKVIEYNILLGITDSGGWLWGPQGMTQARLPVAAWFAAMNECDAVIAGSDTVNVAQYRCGAEISVDMQPVDVIDALNTACNGKTAEIGGVYKPLAGAAGSSVFAFTDDGVIVSAPQVATPFPSLAHVINGVAANYPEPGQGWAMTAAPARSDATALAADGKALLANVSYAAVPYADQVQRLMDAALGEGRKFRTHTLVLPPPAWVIEPCDTITWTSTRNGYTSKLFSVKSVSVLANCDVQLGIAEVDPADYSFSPSTDYLPYVIPPLISLRPSSQAMTGWAVSPVTLTGDNGRRMAGIRLAWSTSVDDVDGVLYQVRLTAGAVTVLTGETDHWSLGQLDITQNLIPNTAYQVRGKYRPHSDRETAWSSWLDVTTPDIRVSGVDLDIVFSTDFSNILSQVKADLSLLHQRVFETGLGGKVDLDKLTGPDSDIARRISTIEATVAGTDFTLISSALLAINTSIDSINGTLTSDATLIAALQSALSGYTGASAVSNAISALNTQVSTDGTNIATNATAITALNSALSGYTGASAVSTAFSTLTTAVSTNTSNIATNTSNIATNTSNISTNASAITSLQSALSGYTGSSAVANAFSTLNTTVTSQGSAITANATAITGVQAQADDATANALFKMEAITAPGGVDARIAMVVRATTGGTAYTEAGIYLDALTGGGSRIALVANQILLDGIILTSGGIGTTHIAANAATIHNSNEVSGPLTPTGGTINTWIDLATLTYTSGGSPVTIDGSFVCHNNDSGSHNFGYRLQRGGSTVWPANALTLTQLNTSSGLYTMKWVETPGAGSTTYTLQWNPSSTSLDALNIVLSTDEIVR